MVVIIFVLVFWCKSPLIPFRSVSHGWTFVKLHFCNILYGGVIVSAASFCAAFERENLPKSVTEKSVP